MKLLEKIKYFEEKEVRLFDIPLIHHGTKNIQNGTERYLSIFPESFEQIFLYKLLEPIYKKHDYMFIVRTKGLGEAYLLNFMIDELIQKHKIKSPCIITHRNVYKDMFRLFNNDNIPCYITENLTIEHYNQSLRKRVYKYKGTSVQVIHSTIQESAALFKKYEIGDIEPYPNVIKKFAGVKNFQNKTPVYNDKDKDILQFVKNLNIDNFIFVIPEAQGVKALPKNFWKNIIAKLKEKGYDIFVNTQNGFSELGFSVPATITQAMYLASLSKGIISIRCGLLELFSSINIPKHILYTWHKFHKVSPENMIKSSSLNHYPMVDSKTVFEYNTDELSEDEIIEKIKKGF